jgi:hypothetical protein
MASATSHQLNEEVELTAMLTVGIATAKNVFDRPSHAFTWREKGSQVIESPWRLDQLEAI